MRQKILGFFVMFLAAVSYGQTSRYIYETSVNPDSINLVSMKTERTFLDIKGNRSVFISENKMKRDSLFASFKSEVKENNKKEEKNFSKQEGRKHIEPTFFDYFITKNIQEQKVYFYDKVAGKPIYYQEDRPLKWEITHSIEKQNGYSAQKAVASFGGRVWTAWFTKEIAISDGPYKFSGLPGLIVKLEDDKGDYKFDLVKKIIVNNAFEEPISADAKQSTRINFHGDKAALDLEFNKNRGSLTGSSGGGNMNFGGGRHGGGMGGGGMHRGMGGEGNGFPTQTANIENLRFNNSISENPIELK
ncbi:MAG: GLPGLI family protein [Chryseobacterium sp.]|uniref:GLPGLI family protein n=1 Tax=Chryseobacterium sp. TaxID=1871047 RepID=UPI0025C34FCE|nr:GLPGLI family protein [Chryseobacterium sp.]MCJ7934152.1 GLPGLI family protein [Chryseobacterium sp.]